MNVIQRMILAKCPDYDFGRYRFKSGDLVRTNDCAVVLITESALDYVTGYIIRRGLKYRTLGKQRVLYSDLPDVPKGAFTSLRYPIQTSINWKVGEFRVVDDLTVFLTEGAADGWFYAYVLEPANSHYLHTCVTYIILIENM